MTRCGECGMRDAECGEAPWPLRHFVPSSLRPFRRAFSLLEVMIAIVILGLGLIMVATMFPVAWDRARTLSEATIQQTVTDNAAATVKSLARVSGDPSTNVYTYGSSFAGDLQLDPAGFRITACPVLAPPYDRMTGDTRVHALNLENVRIAPGTADPRVAEDPWAVGSPSLTIVQKDLADWPNPAGRQLLEASFFTPRVAVSQRVFPAIDTRPLGAAATSEAFTRWDDRLTTSRFSWAAFHRLRSVGCFDPSNPDFGAVRTFDMLYVTLRRPQPTHRYARQDTRAVPDPCNLQEKAVVPKALRADEDVMFPVAWRVQVQFPDSVVRRWTDRTRTSKTEADTGIPTEVEVPPSSMSGGAPVGVMMVQMFPVGAQFIDELTGQVFRVAKRRVLGSDGEKAVLTLDREVVKEDLDLPCVDVCGVSVVDPRCPDCFEKDLCPPSPGDLADLANQELLRTVWVFPPPVEPGHPAGTVTFDGSSPVVGITGRTLTLAPTQ